jgi:hypothetical protein
MSEGMTLARAAIRIVVGGVILALGSGAALGQPTPSEDQDKLLYEDGKGWILYWVDEEYEPDGYHDSYEPYYDEPEVITYRTDLSCWMASASNMLQYEGHGNPYEGWLRIGGGASPNVDPWGNPCHANDDSNRDPPRPREPQPFDTVLTFDDGAYQHFGFARAGVPYLGPIITTQKFVAGTWATNPISWCQDKLMANHPVGLAVWTTWRGQLTPNTHPGGIHLGYHAITLWEIDEGANTVTITDSDDRFNGERVYSYTYAGNDWVVKNYFGRDWHVNYAVSFPTVVGGCCTFPDKDCFETTPEVCDAIGGFYLGDDTECLGDNDGDGRDDACVGTIPTVSEWGLVILALLLLVGAKLHFGRRWVNKAA